MIAQRHRVDLFLGHEQQNLVPAFVQRLSHRKPREEMPPSAAAGDDELLGHRHGM